MEPIITQLAQELDQNPQYVANVVQLLDEGNTIPFIARYRKEHHGAMDDTTLRNLEERLQYLRGLQERREAVKKSIEEQGRLTEELAQAIDAAATLAEVEDLYRPYKQKRRTRAAMARFPGMTTRRRRVRRASSRSSRTETFSFSSFSPRLMARTWWPCIRERGWVKL